MRIERGNLENHWLIPQTMAATQSRASLFGRSNGMHAGARELGWTYESCSIQQLKGSCRPWRPAAVAGA